MKKSGLENEKQPQADGAPDGSEPLMVVEPASVSAEQLDGLRERAAKADEHWDRLLRTTADFDNFKKRAAREKQEAQKFANESLLSKLIPVLDNFEMALTTAQNGQPEALKSLQTGIAMIHQQFKAVLADAGLEELDAAGKPFDQNLHEAVSQKETAEAPDGQVVQQLR